MSQLHKRLQHLVHYSSQLIFVSSDSIADQQRTLSEFLSLQQESTEVSFFTADKEQKNTDYRRTICRQLASHQVGSYVRSLKELLHNLDPEHAQYLVCISQAQMLERDFVEELWQWISACRQRYDGLHVNVILFAEQEWTEQTQAWLPSHNENSPVLLSSQSVDVVGFDVSALETLMAQKRAFFAADTAHNIIRKKWFIASVLVAFFAIFVSLMAFQYPEQIQYLINHGKLPAQIEEIDTANNLPAPTGKDSDDDLVLQTREQELGYQPNIEIVEHSLTDSILVANWPDEESNSQAIDSSEDTNTIISDSDLIGAESGVDEQSNTQELKLQDDATTNVPVEPKMPTVAMTTPAELPIVAGDYEFNELELLKLTDQQFLVQLSGIQNRQVLEEYLRDNNLEQGTWIYKTERYGGDWFVVLINESFASLNEANSAIEQLPETIRASGPFAKRSTQAKQEIQATSL